MDYDLDRALARLAATPVHARLAELDVDALIRRAGDARDARRGLGIGAVSVCGALIMGVAASTTLAAPTPRRDATLPPFAAGAPLAPSTLLEEGR